MLTVVLAGAAGWLAMPAPPARGLRRMQASRVRGRRQWRVTPVTLVAMLTGTAMFLLVGLHGVGWVVAAAVACGTVAWLVMARRHAKAANRRAKEVAEAIRLLASLLRAGQHPVGALREAARDHLLLAEAAVASSLGADVAAALARGAAAPGAEGLRTVSAAWQVSMRSGAPVAGVLDAVADTLRRQRQLGEVVETELSAARASGHIMAMLPIGAVVLGVLAGGNPVGFLLTAAVGQWLVAAAVVLTAAGVVWTERLAG